MSLVTGCIIGYLVGVAICALIFARCHMEEPDYRKKPLKLTFDSIVVGLFWPLYILVLMASVV